MASPVFEVSHGVTKALDLHGTHLGVEGEVGEVHGTSRLKLNIKFSSESLVITNSHLDGQPHTPQHLPGVHYPQELVLCRGLRGKIVLYICTPFTCKWQYLSLPT